MAEDQLEKVTLAHLARAERICPRRLEREHANGSGNRGGNGRWRISNQVTEDVRLAHTDLTVPRPDRFTPTTDLTPEQRHVYGLAVSWYLTLFADRPVRVVDEDAWGTDRPEGVRLVGRAGLAFTDADENIEIRLLQFGARPASSPELIAWPAVRFALLRRSEWLAGRSARVVVADLVRGTCDEATIDAGAVMAELDDWLGERIALIRDRIANPKPRRGLECAWCPFIAGCEAHR